MNNLHIKDTDLAKGLLNDKDELFGIITYAKCLYYVLSGNTIYQRKAFFRRHNTEWLDSFSPKFSKHDYIAYVPVATLEDGVYIGYTYEDANLSNQVLDICNRSKIENFYPNLYWVDVGNHPYPRAFRFNHNWRQTTYNKYCNKIIYSNPDPSKAFLTPTELGL